MRTVTGVSSESGEEPLTLYLVKRLELAIRAVMDDRLRPRGLTTLQYTALSVLRRRSDLSSAQLARRSFVRPQTMHQMILLLEERDLIERRRDPGNRRVLLISLTPAGRALLHECDPVVRAIEAEMVAGMPFDQRAGFRTGLEHGYQGLARLAHPQGVAE
jgi:DNA-binding MarR family transcriptional regulator